MTTAPEIITPPVTTYDASGALDLGRCACCSPTWSRRSTGCSPWGRRVSSRPSTPPSAPRSCGPPPTCSARTGRSRTSVPPPCTRRSATCARPRTPASGASPPSRPTTSRRATRASCATTPRCEPRRTASSYAYVFPDVACSDVSPELLAVLAELGLDGVKTSGAASARVDAYRSAAPRLALWSGNDADLPHVVAAGGRGTVSGVSGVAPRAFADLRAALAADDAAAVVRAQAVVQRLVAALGPASPASSTASTSRGCPAGRRACRSTRRPTP